MLLCLRKPPWDSRALVWKEVTPSWAASLPGGEFLALAWCQEAESDLMLVVYCSYGLCHTHLDIPLL